MNQKLYRIKSKDTVFGGVSLGLGRYFNIDPVLVRIAIVLLCFSVPPTFVVYFILWAILPVEQESYQMAYDSGTTKTDNQNFNNSNFATMSKNSNNGNLVGGLILIVLGSLFAIQSFFDIEVFSLIGKMWPLFIVGLGVWLIVKNNDNSGPSNFNSDSTSGDSSF